MHTCHTKLRYFDWDGNVHLTKGKTGGQQGDPLEMLVFNLTIHHLWGRVLEKFPEVAYTDDGYIKGKLSVAPDWRGIPLAQCPHNADPVLLKSKKKNRLTPKKMCSARLTCVVEEIHRSPIRFWVTVTV